ncbi:MAG: SDR family NAD(P)-dependent oxidoreductase [Tateyamaria sp.]|jgi:NAD(P)-dependent dehydrogenase (short-subunit alcohol dehydrogenase family)|nr:SDR family NAD(P)-dependent oxidoreductase [Tateyamaria sp.]
MSHILIVGSGDYVGAAIARRFAKGGWTVSMGRRRGDALAPLVKEITQSGGKAYAYKLDARDEDSVSAIFAASEAIAPLDVVVFNVGGNVRFGIQDTTARVFRKVWEMACFGGFLTGRAAAQVMIPRGQGCIFFTGATASMRGGAGFSAFSAAKGGLRNLAQSMARELGPQGVHVAHLVIDAAVDTEWVRQIMQDHGEDPDKLAPDTLMNPTSVAEAYWTLAHQPRDAWSFEMDIRPYKETW